MTKSALTRIIPDGVLMTLETRPASLNGNIIPNVPFSSFITFENAIGNSGVQNAWQDSSSLARFFLTTGFPIDFATLLGNVVLAKGGSDSGKIPNGICAIFSVTEIRSDGSHDPDVFQSLINICQTARVRPDDINLMMSMVGWFRFHIIGIWSGFCPEVEVNGYGDPLSPICCNILDRVANCDTMLLAKYFELLNLRHPLANNARIYTGSICSDPETDLERSPFEYAAGTVQYPVAAYHKTVYDTQGGAVSSNFKLYTRYDGSSHSGNSGKPATSPKPETPSPAEINPVIVTRELLDKEDEPDTLTRPVTKIGTPKPDLIGAKFETITTVDFSTGKVWHEFQVKTADPEMAVIPVFANPGDAIGTTIIPQSEELKFVSASDVANNRASGYVVLCNVRNTIPDVPNHPEGISTIPSNCPECNAVLVPDEGSEYCEMRLLNDVIAYGHSRFKCCFECTKSFVEAIRDFLKKYQVSTAPAVIQREFDLDGARLSDGHRVNLPVLGLPFNDIASFIRDIQDHPEQYPKQQSLIQKIGSKNLAILLRALGLKHPHKTQYIQPKWFKKSPLECISLIRERQGKGVTDSLKLLTDAEMTNSTMLLSHIDRLDEIEFMLKLWYSMNPDEDDDSKKPVKTNS